MNSTTINGFSPHQALNTSLQGSLLVMQMLNITRNATNLQEPDSSVINNISSYKVSSQAPQLDEEVPTITPIDTTLLEPDSAVINNISSYEATSQAPQLDEEVSNTTPNSLQKKSSSAIHDSSLHQALQTSADESLFILQMLSNDIINSTNLEQYSSNLREIEKEIRHCRRMELLKFEEDLYQKSQQEALYNLKIVTENNRITLMKCEEDLHENSERFTNVMESLTQDDREGCILKQLVTNQNIYTLRELLQHNANVNGFCHGSSILHAAAATNNEVVIQMVLDNGADVNIEDSNGLTPVQLAAIQGYDKAVTKLVGKSIATRHGESKDKLPHLAARAGHVSVLKALHNLFPLKMVKETNKLKETPLLVAAANGHLEAVKALIVMGADLKDSDRNGNTALYKAIDGKHNDTVDYLLSLKQFDVNAPNKKGNTPFHLVLLRGQEDLANKLIHNGYGADVWSEGADGQTALHFAAYSNMEGFLKMLLSAGMDINKRTKQNETPLHVAVRENSKEAVIVLINGAGVDLNAKNKDGDTPLHFAAISNANEIAEALLIKGADLLEQNNFKMTPFDLSRFYKNFEIALILREAENKLL